MPQVLMTAAPFACSGTRGHSLPSPGPLMTALGRADPLASTHGGLVTRAAAFPPRLADRCLTPRCTSLVSTTHPSAAATSASAQQITLISPGRREAACTPLRAIVFFTLCSMAMSLKAFRAVPGRCTGRRALSVRAEASAKSVLITGGNTGVTRMRRSRASRCWHGDPAWCSMLDRIDLRVSFGPCCRHRL